MKIAYTPTGINNFHNSQSINLIITGETIFADAVEVYTISANQANRVKKHFCGMSDCKCPQGAPIELDWTRDGKLRTAGIRVEWCERI